MPGLPNENVQDYPRPPALEPCSAEILVWFGGAEIIRTSNALRVFETHHAPTYYIPISDVRAELTPTPGASFCEWKGRARYFDIATGGKIARRAAWEYPNPTDGFRAIVGHIALYASTMDRCEVGGMAVAPQPGDFYGGWVTANLTGIVKGGPGTEGW